MRNVTTHHTNEANSKLSITASNPGPGGAFHSYHVECGGMPFVVIDFQNGAIKEVGVNGVTHEVLLAIVRDRLEDFQKGPYACTENAVALHYVVAAQLALEKRTKRRTEQGIEGTMRRDPGPSVVDPHNPGVDQSALEGG